MRVVADRSAAPAAIRTDLGALELSKSTWLITSLSPGSGEKMSKHAVRGGDITGLLARFAQLQDKAQARAGRHFACRRRRLDCHVAPAASCQDRQDRW